MFVFLSILGNLLEMCSSLMETVLNEKDPDYKPPQSLKDLQKNVEQAINVPLQTKYAKSIIRLVFSKFIFIY